MNSRQQETDVVSLTRTRVGVFVVAAGVIGSAAAAVALTPQGRSAVSKIVKGNEWYKRTLAVARHRLRPGVRRKKVKTHYQNLLGS